MAYIVEAGGPAQFYARTVPRGAIAVGIVRKDTGETGALLRFKNGTCAQIGGTTPEEFAASATRRIVFRSTPVRRAISRCVAPPCSSVSMVIRKCDFKTFTPSPSRW